jgi:gliding motility-associated-like protein
LYIYDETGTVPNCFDEETFTVTINATPVYTLTPTDPSVCNATDGSILIDGLLVGGSFDVLIDDGTQTNMPGEIANGSGQITIGNLGYGTYTITITPTGSACVGLPVVTVLINPGAPTLDLIADTTVCDLFNLEAITGVGLTGSETYWSASGATGTQYNVGDPITSTMTMYAYDINGACAVEEPFLITVNVTPVLDAIIDVTECDSYALPAITGTSLSGNENYYNDSQLNGGTALAGPLTSTQTVWVYDENGLCSDELSFLVTINPLPTAINLTGGGTYCQGDAIGNITMEVTGTANWTIDYTLDGSPLTVNGAASPIDLGNAPGVYVVTGVTDANCTNTASGTETIVINPIPSAPTAGVDTLYCSTADYVNMTASGSGGTMNWYDDAGLSNSIGTGDFLMPFDQLGASSYYVTETLLGCEGPASMVTITIQNCDITLPTAITPNGDNINDTWEIIDLDLVYPDNVVRIYNRWGNLIFEHDSSTDGPYDDNRWDGTFEGGALPVASYFYLIEFNDNDGNTESGAVSILMP